MSKSHPFLSKEDQLAEAMRVRIRSGAWGVRVPGVFKLVSEFDVSRNLVTKAVALLVKSGDVEIPGRRKAMRVTSKGGFTRRTGTLIVHGTVENVVPTGRAKLLESLATGMPAPTNLLRLDTSLPDEAVFRTIMQSDAEVLVLLDRKAEVADRLCDAGRRVVMLGGIGVPQRAPCVITSLEDMVRGALRLAFAAGHSRVCFPLWNRSATHVVTMRRQIAEEYAAAGRAHRPDFDAPLIEKRNPDAAHECLLALFRVTPPTAVILQDAWIWYAAISTFGAMRLRVPEDVSTIMLTDMPELEAYRPSQAHFSQPGAALVREIRRILRAKPSPTSITSVVPSVWVPGGSLGPPRAKR